MKWAEFEAQAPELAALGKERFERTHVALIATLREDGSPRISPIEPVLANGHLLFGSMRSVKTRDLQRDARCALHSSISDINGSEGEFKVSGRAVPADADARDSGNGWWTRFPSEAAAVFYLDIERAAFVGWDIDKSEMRVLRWSPDRGVIDKRRPYP